MPAFSPYLHIRNASHFAEVADPPSEILVRLTNNVVIGIGAARERVEASTAFMELREAPRLWRCLLEGWLLLVSMLIGAIYAGM